MLTANHIRIYAHCVWFSSSMAGICSNHIAITRLVTAPRGHLAWEIWDLMTRKGSERAEDSGRHFSDYKFWSGQHTLYYHWSIVLEDECSRDSEQDKRSWENPCIWSSITGKVILSGFPPSWSLSEKFRGKVWRSLQFFNIKRIFRIWVASMGPHTWLQLHESQQLWSLVCPNQAGAPWNLKLGQVQVCGASAMFEISKQPQADQSAQCKDPTPPTKKRNLSCTESNTNQQVSSCSFPASFLSVWTVWVCCTKDLSAVM